jgi:ABC-type amino acid transport substrate-binding protein
MLSTVKLVADPYPPYQFERDGEIAGIDHDIISEAFKIHNVEVETALHDWDECVALLDAGKADGIFQITRTPERVGRFIFSDRLRTARTIFFKRTESAIVPGGGKSLVSQLNGTKVGVLAGYSYNEEVDGLESELKVEKNSSEGLLRGLARGEFSLALMDEGVAAFLMKGLEIEGVEQVPGFDIRRDLFVAFRKDLSGPVRCFNSGLEEIRKSGVYDSVAKRYSL